MDALGRRAVKSDGSSGTVYGYDLAGRPIAENTLSGGPLREYVNLEGMPLALIANGQVYSIHTDHLGTPQQMTDQSGAVAWDAAFLPFGQASQLWAPVPNNRRFPGQYFDAETGFHHNGFRDYDPSIGRYIESDPIGLAGGLNTYAYVGGNPVSRIDEDGLQAALPAPAGPLPLPLPPIAVPGTPENKAWTQWAVGQIEKLLGNPGTLAPMAMSVPPADDARKSVDAAKMCKAETANEDHCDHQYYEVDIPICRGIERARGSRAAERCYASAAKRYAACLRGQPIPPHDTWNN